MKRLKQFVARLLLFVMVAFVAHDYLIGQHDIAGHGITATCQQAADTAAHQVAMEHQVFHILAIGEAAKSLGPLHERAQSDFFVESFHPKTLLRTFFVPPKHA